MSRRALDVVALLTAIMRSFYRDWKRGTRSGRRRGGDQDRMAGVDAVRDICFGRPLFHAEEEGPDAMSR
jgi:hypothetical protein